MKIYTDASTRVAKGISGVAFVITDNKDVEICRKSSVVREADNNTAELRAICYALAYCKNIKEPIVILTDSTYAINAIRGGFYRKSEEKLLNYIHSHISDKKYKIFHVKGHCHDGTVLSHYNKIADKTAKRARVNYELQLKKQKKLRNQLIQKQKQSSR